MIETSSLTFSAGRVEMNMKEGLRVLPGGVVSEDDGLAIAKQTFFPAGDAVYAPQSPYWPSSVGLAPPAAAVAGSAVEAAAGPAGGLCLGAFLAARAAPADA